LAFLVIGLSVDCEVCVCEKTNLALFNYKNFSLRKEAHPEQAKATLDHRNMMET